MNKVFQVLSDVLGSAVGTAIFMKVAEHGAPELTKRVLQSLDEKSRPDVMKVIQDEKLSEESRKVLYDRLDRAQREGMPDLENAVVRSLGRFLPRDDDGKVNYNEAVKRFEVVAKMDDRRFAVFINALKDDRVAQQWHQINKVLGRASESVVSSLLEGIELFAEQHGRLEVSARELHERRKRKWIL